MKQFTLSIFALLGIINGISGQTQVGPGGVGDASNMAVWLDASQLGLSNGDPVVTWTDLSGNGNDATQGTPAQQGSFSSSGPMNSMPSVTLDGNDGLSTGAVSMLDTDEYSYFVVSKSSSQYFTGANAFMLETSTSFSSVTWRAYLFRSNDFLCGNQFFGLASPSGIKRASSVIGAKSNLTNSMIFNAILYPGDNMTARTNGGLLGTNTGLNHSGFTHTNTVIGYTGLGSDAGYIGDISEVIIFAKSLNTAEEKIIQNYLGAKYGITLQSGAVVYGHPGTHSVEVAGIGRDDASNEHLSAKGSGTVHVTAASLDDADFLMWGHDGAVQTTQTSNRPADYVLTDGEVMTRMWRTTELGETGDLTFKVDMSGIHFGNPDDYQLLIDDDGDFTNGGTIQIDGTLTVDELSFSVLGTELSNTNYFTIGNSKRTVISVLNGQDWNDITTWSCSCIPTSSQNVVIDNGHTVTVSDAQSVLDLTIESTGVLALSSTGILNVVGNITSDGSIESNVDGLLTFTGSAAQSITATGTQEIGSLTLDNTNGLTLVTGLFNFSGILTATDGDMNFGDNDVTFVSSASGTAVIGVTGASASFSGMGDVKVQRFIPTGVAGSRSIGTPLVSMALREWDDEIFISGTGFPDGCASGGNGCYHSASYWRADLQKYRTVNDIDSNILNGNSIEIFLGDNLSTFAGRVLTAAGTPNTSMSVDIPVQNGWNLISNPFLSPIDFDNVTRNGSTGNYFYVYDVNNGSFQYWDGDGQVASHSFLDGGIISSSQGFWVNHSGTSSTITIDQISKDVNAEDNYLRSGIQNLTQNNLYFELYTSDDVKKAVGGIKFIDEWKSEETKSLPKFSPPHLSILSVYTMDELDNEVILNKTLQKDECFSMPVYVDVLRTGEYTIEFKNPQGEYSVFVKDNATGELVLLTHDMSFDFSIDNEIQKVNPFTLEFKKKQSCPNDSDLDAESFNVFTSTNHININSLYPMENDVTISVISTLGSKVMGDIKLNKNSNSISIPTKGLSGLYLVTISDLNGQVIELEKLFISNK